MTETTVTGQTSVLSWKGKISGYPLRASPSPTPTRAPHQTETTFLGLRLLQRERESPRQTSSSPSIAGSFPRSSSWVSPHRNHWGNLWNFAPEMEKRDETYRIRRWDLGRLRCSCPQRQAEVPASDSGDPQSRGSGPVWPARVFGGQFGLVQVTSH